MKRRNRIFGRPDLDPGPTRGGEQHVPHWAFSLVRNDKNDGTDFAPGAFAAEETTTGAKARIIPSALRGAEAPLFHGCIGRSTGQAGLSRTLENVGIDGAFPGVFSLG